MDQSQAQVATGNLIRFGFGPFPWHLHHSENSCFLSFRCQLNLSEIYIYLQVMLEGWSDALSPLMQLIMMTPESIFQNFKTRGTKKLIPGSHESTWNCQQ